MKILKKVQIKQVLTETSKEKLRQKFIKAKSQLEQECQQLLFEQKKLKSKIQTKQNPENRFYEEIKKREEKIQLVDFKLEQLELLELGSEIVEKEVESLVEVTVGSRSHTLMGKSVIVIEDDVVVRIEE